MKPKPHGEKTERALLQALPYLRRFARALTGSQELGDDLCVATLEHVTSPAVTFDAPGAKMALFSAFHGMWRDQGTPVSVGDDGLPQIAQKHLSTLRSNAREALLLHTIEEWSIPDISTIMGAEPDEVSGWIEEGRDHVRQSASGSIMIIEDESMIAMDLKSIVTAIGHRVTGVASTKEAAVLLAKHDYPDLFLVDIKLADNSSGIDAIEEIFGSNPEVPVIFVTAFPERLLTGTRPEPTFLITKPYTEDQVSAAVAQAMFFASVEPLLG